MSKKSDLIIPDEVVMNKIYLIRGQKVMIDRDLAELYQVETKRLKEQVKRNINRFPDDFMFEMSKDELENWRSQFATSKSDQMGLRHNPYCFTEHGVLMLSSVLNSEKAIEVNIRIMRIFTRFRQMLTENTDLRLAIAKLEKKTENNTKNIEVVFQYIDELLEKQEKLVKPVEKREIPRKLIGYKAAKRIKQS